MAYRLYFAWKKCSWGCLALALMIGSAHWPNVARAVDVKKAVDPEKKLPEPRDEILTTADGLSLYTKYYGSDLGKDAVPIVLLHGYKGSHADYDELAAYLQQMHYAVIVPDLRGHGKSTKFTKTGAAKDLDVNNMKATEYGNMVKYDMEAINSFLLGKNNAGELNLDKLCVIGAEMGSIVAANWSLADWSWPQLPTLRQGRDIKALVLISPEMNFKGATINKAALQNKDLSLLLIVGNQNPKSLADAKRINEQLERVHPAPDPEQAAEKQELYFYPLETSLQGTKIVKEKQLRTDEMIAKFIELRLVKKQIPWSLRKSPLD